MSGLLYIFLEIEMYVSSARSIPGLSDERRWNEESSISCHAPSSVAALTR